MAKYGNTYYMQLTRKLFDEPYSKMSQNAKWLYIVLKELEQRYCGGASKRDFFIRTNEELCNDSGMSMVTLKKAKSELAKSGLVILGKAHWIVDADSNKLSKKHITSYKIVD